MEKNILIPIDFSIESLYTLEQVLNDHRNIQLNVILVYGRNLNDSSLELLFYSPIKIIQSLMSTAFYDSLTILRNSFESNAKSISIKLYHGYNQNAFNNFCIANKIEAIYIPKHYKLLPRGKDFDLIPLIKNSGLAYHEINWEKDINSRTENELSQLFNYSL